MLRKTLTIVSGNPVWLRGGRYTADRKFLDGFLNYASHLDAPLLAVNALASEDEVPPMDVVTHDVGALPYRVLGLALDRRGRTLPESTAHLHEAIAGSALVYGWPYRSYAIARMLNVPHVAWLENDLSTQMDLVRLDSPNRLRGAVRALRVASTYFREVATCLRSSRAVHCNGYPAARAAARYNGDCLMYLDSRMSAGMVIGEDALERRLASRAGRSLRLIFSGRYEAIKGADHAVRVALECLRRGYDVQMDCYGQGALAEAMRGEAAVAADRVRVHDAISYPELVRRANEADLFVCCHVQSDPSCTYLESMGSGLPIAGYPNRMWSAMEQASKAGAVSARRVPADLADVIGQWIADPAALAAASRRARGFALEHCFEVEFRLRTDSLNALYRESLTERKDSMEAARCR
jgi:colanic acid/amylovoran biosynthesis glycosyltransferase